MELATDELHLAKRKLLDMTKKWQKTKEDLTQTNSKLSMLADQPGQAGQRGGSARPAGRQHHGSTVARAPLVRSMSWATPKRKFVGGGFNIPGDP